MPFASAESAAEAMTMLGELLRDRQEEYGRDWMARSQNTIKLRVDFAQTVDHLDAKEARGLVEVGSGEMRKRVMEAKW